MSNLSQKKRQRMFEMLARIREEHRGDDETLSAINEIENELNSKKYGLVWEEHEEAVNVQMRTHIPVFTEDTDKEITSLPEGDYNFLLEGDNLHSLYLLDKTHRGRIDVIYIDPPYNTGNDDFIYDDKKIDTKDGFRHSKWLSFMNERLQVAKNLLSDNGVIFISIDDNELAPLRMLCDEIFGELNFVTAIHWRRSESQNNTTKLISNVGEYILCYLKNKTKDSAFNKIDLSEKALKEYRYSDERGKFRRGTIVDNTRGKNIIEIVSPSGIKKTIKSIRKKEFIEEQNGKGLIYWTASGTPYLKIYLDNSEGQVANNWFDNVGVNEDASEILTKIGVSFDYSKPHSMIQRLISMVADKNSIILDFFAGSGTTAQAVLELNKQDGGNRKFILCTNNENNICTDVTYPRINTVISGKRQDGSVYSDGIPANLKYYRTDFVARDCEYLSDELLEHITEMIQLENGVKIDGSQYIMLLDEQDADELAENWSEYPDVKEIYVAKDVLFTTEQAKIFSDVDIKTIPDYYFEFDLRQEGESW